MSGAAISADATFEIAAIAMTHSGSSGLLALARAMRWSTASALQRLLGGTDEVAHALEHETVGRSAHAIEKPQNLVVALVHAVAGPLDLVLWNGAA